MRKITYAGVLAVLATAWLGTQATCCNAMAATPVDFATARAQFEAGRAGSADATDLAQRLFSGLLSTDSKNPLYLAYYGSTFALQARDARLPWKRIKLINEGNALLDEALSLLDHPHAHTEDATTLETRLIAVATFVALPETLFHRFETAKRQYQQAVSSPYFATAPIDLRGHMQYEGALIARQESNVAAERSALQQVLALGPPSIDLAEVRARLAELH